jgi:hypothetical protein
MQTIRVYFVDPTSCLIARGQGIHSGRKENRWQFDHLSPDAPLLMRHDLQFY